MPRNPNRAALHVERLEDRTTPVVRLFAVGAGPGGLPQVNVYSLDASSTSYHLVATFLAYNAAFRGGVNVSCADLNGDGVDDVVTGAGPGGGPGVEVFDGAALLKGQPVIIRRFYAYAPNFTGGVYVAAAPQAYDDPKDPNGNFLPGIITGAGAGGGPHVRVFDFNTLKVALQFYAYAPNFTGGVRVAAGPGTARITTGAGPGGGPHVKVYSDIDGPLTLSDQFYAYDPSFAGGVFVGTGEELPNTVAVSPGPGGPEDVRLYSAGRSFAGPYLSVTPYPGFTGGATVTIVGSNDITNLSDFIVTGPGPTGLSLIRLFDDLNHLAQVLQFEAFAPTFLGGVSVG